MFGRACRDVVRLYRRSWWFVAIVQLVSGLLLAVPIAFIAQVANAVVAAQGQALASSGALSSFTVLLLLVLLLVCLPLGLVGVSSTVRTVNDSLAGHEPRLWAAFGEGFRRIPALAGAASITIAGTVLLVVLSPVFSVLGLIALLLTPVVRLVRHRRERFLPRWPDVVTLVWAVVPLGLALRFIAGAMLFAPAVVLERLGPIAALRAGADAAGPHRLRFVGFVVAGVLSSVALQMAATWVGSSLGAVGGLIAQVTLQVFLVALPAVLVTVLFRLGRSVGADGTLPASHSLPYRSSSSLPPRRQPVGAPAPALVRRIAILMPFVVVVAGIGLAPTAANAAPVAMSFSVNSAADSTDEATVVAQAANCVAGSGVCTLRAAVRAAQDAASTGTSGTIAITFAGSYTIAVGTPITFNERSGGEGGEQPGGEGGETPGAATSGVLSIDGAGRTVVLDGQGATQVLSVQSNRWGLSLAHLQISRGAVAGSEALGGAVFLVTPSPSLIDSVTFDRNHAANGGGAVAALNGSLTIVNSTFVGNSTGFSGDYPSGGADVYSLYGTASINNSTFVGYGGTSVLSTYNATTSLSNSLFDPRGGTSVVACTGSITGSTNVVSGTDTSCPGTIPNAGPSVSDLHSLPTGGPAVMTLVPASDNAAIASAGGGGLTCATTDQRGLTRAGVTCDAGAVVLDPTSGTSLASSHASPVFGSDITFTATVALADGGSTVTNGSVVFDIDGVTRTVAVAAGSAALTVEMLAAGTHTVVATYVPVNAALIAGSQSSVLTQEVAKSGSTVTLTSSANPALTTGSATVSATVTAQDPDVVPSGTLTLRDTTTGVTIGGVTTLVNGVATFDVSGLTPGRHTLVGSYSGDNNNLAADSPALDQVMRVPSALGSSASDTTIEYGRGLTVTVSVPSSGSLGSPTGTVTVTVQGSARTLTLDGTGSASTRVDDIPVGSWTITASYSGDDRYAPSTAEALAVTVATAPTVTTLTVADDTIAYGVPVELTATVSRTNGTAPIGSITFSAGSTELQTVTLAPGTGSSASAIYTPSAGQLPVGSTSLTAVFTPDYGYEASTSSVSTITVGTATATVALASGDPFAPVGTPVTFTATLSGADGSVAVPDGSVEFFSGSTSLGTSTISGGVATRTETFASIGSRTITAKYLGSGSFSAAASAAITQSVVAEGVVTVLSLSPVTTSPYGTLLRFEVTVTGSDSGLPGVGSVVVRDGSTIVATIPLVNGSGARTVGSPSAGSHAYQATFEPSTTDFSGGSSDVVTYSVSAAATSTELTFSGSSSVHGNPTTLTATVSSASATPVGAVTFTTGDATLGTVPLVDGVASLTVGLPQSADFPNGERAVVATFTSSGDFVTSSDSVLYAVARGTTSLGLELVGTKAGEAQSLVATVTTLTGTGSPSGTITFSGGSGAVGTVALVNGVATLTGVTLPAGTRLVQATYSSTDRDFAAPAQNPIVENVVVAQGTPTVAVASSSTSAVAYGSATTLTATVDTAGVAATGSVRFTATGPDGDRDLGTASIADGTAVLSTRRIPVGTQTITASYLGDGNLVPVTSAGITQIVSQTATTTTLTTAPAPSQPGQQITLRAAVTSPTTTVDVGTVEFLLGGQSLATVALVSGVATYTSTATVVGEVAVQARYTSSTSDFADSSASAAHTVVGRGVALYLRVPNTGAFVGDAMPVSVEMRAAPGVVGAPETLPGGQVTVSDGAGFSCVVELVPESADLVGGDCDIRFTSAGLRSLTASYAGDTLYAAAASEPIVVVASTRTTGVRLTSPGRWIPGDAVTLDWAVEGPTTPGAAVTIRDGSTVLCTSTALSGSCAYTVPQHPAEVSLVLTYAGTNEWAYQSTILTKAITACVPVGRVGVSPSNGGTVTAVTPTNCGTNGYLPGTAVELRATAAEGFTFSRWNDPGDITTTVYVLAQEGGTIGDTAFFSRPCVEVTFTVLGGTRYGGQELESNAVPNCDAGWVRSDYRSQTGMFQVGTVIDLKAVVPSTPPGTAPQKLYGWSGLAAGSDQTSLRQSYTVTSALFQEVTASFGISCVHDIRVVQPTGGTIALGGANCTDDIGSGYRLGSSIPIRTTATGDAYFSTWTGNIRPLTQTSTSATGTVTVYATNPAITANYSQCVSFTATSTGYIYLSGGDGFASGTATVTPTGNCPTRGEGWYVPGTKVSIDTTGSLGTTFDGWKTDLPLQAMATTQKNFITLNTSGTANALWYAANQCKPYSVRAVQPQYTTVTSSLSGGDQGCPAGQLNSALGGTSGQQITLTATATQGDPLLGWSGMTTRWKDSSVTASQQLAGSTLNPRTVGIASNGSFSAWACQAIDTTLTLVSPNGTRNSTPLPSGTDFVGASPAPDCPIAASAYTLGQDVFPQALEQSAGYTFVGWSGAVNSTDEYPATPITIDGASRYIALTATYQVNCFTLTTNTQHTRVETEPNCPDTPASENKYIGGTLITLQTIGNAGTKVFRGFTGDFDGQSGIYSWVSIEKDSAIYSNYETRTAGEAITDALSDAANGAAIAAKKAVGVVAAVAAAFVMGDNPVLMVASLVVLLGMGVQAIADEFNLSSDGLKAFTGGIQALSQTLTLLQSVATCATVWSASSGSSTAQAKDVGTTAMGAAGTVIANRILEAKNRAADLREAQRAAQSAAMAAAYDARLANQLLSTSDEATSAGTRALNYVTATATSASDSVTKALDAAKGPLETVGRLGDVALVGYTIYSEYQNQSTGWDSSAESAWTTGGDVYMNCMMDAIPPYFGVPPRQT